MFGIEQSVYPERSLFIRLQDDFCGHSCIFSRVMMAEADSEVAGNVSEAVTPQGVFLRPCPPCHLCAVNPGFPVKRFSAMRKGF